MRSNRREFLQASLGTSAAISIGATVPSFLQNAAAAGNDDKETVLVVVQLSGGNDGLNTVIPFSDPAYRSSRPKLAIAENDILKINDELGFHSSARGLADLLEDGSLAIVQGVGYDNPNRSHFESMDIWHTCVRKDQSRSDGWIGRTLQHLPTDGGADVAAIHLGDKKQPFALASQTIRVPTVKRIEEFELLGKDPASLRRLLRFEPQSAGASTDASSGDDELLSFLRSSTSGAIAASERITEVAMAKGGDDRYPRSQMGEKLGVVAKLIGAGIKTRVYYVQLDGFDTHAEQPETHAILLRQWSEAVSTFVDDMHSQGNLDRVCVMTFSEFGRRVAENASEGTDHGAAGPMFFCGGGLVPGLHGKQPSLTDLDQGDLKHGTDFRSVYAAVLENWLRVDSAAILGGGFDPVPVFA